MIASPPYSGKRVTKGELKQRHYNSHVLKLIEIDLHYEREIIV